jgi:aspartate/methionine/tyrosine aminotransferase
MLKPNGALAKNMDPLLLIHLWSRYLDQEWRNSGTNAKMIFAGIGKPSYFLNEDIASQAMNYWRHYVGAIAKVKQSIAEEKSLSSDQRCDEIAKAATAIDYGLPAGEYETKSIMALALSHWYKRDITPDEIIFTVGGWIALKMIFRILNTRDAGGRIITPFPYYTFYNNPDHNNNLHFIDMMSEPGYRLTACAVEKSIQEAYRLAVSDGKKISAFLFCDPHNPLGSVVGEQEWKSIAHVLKTTSDDIPIIIDEAYAEMVFVGKHVSLLQAAPELKNRLIIIRSATKSLSASGERMAVVMCFNEVWREELLDEIFLSYLHMPKSLQYAYAQALLNFSDEKRKNLVQFYQLQSELVQKRLNEMRAQLPDSAYTIEGTFYVLANLSDLLGTEIPKAAERALGKTGLITTDEDICYSLLFRDQVMITALSYFGVAPSKGFVRITCSGGITELTELMNRIEYRLTQARKSKKGIKDS